MDTKRTEPDSIRTVLKFHNASLNLTGLNNVAGKVVARYTSVGFEVLFTVAACSGIRYWLQPGHHSSLTAPNLQPTANQERNDKSGSQHYSRELLMMGIVMPEKC